MALTFLFLILTACVMPSELLVLNETFYSQSKLSEDGKLDFKGLALKYNLLCEEHDVTTEDKYILQVFRIPPRTKPKGLPVLLLHGILDSSDTFMIRGNTSMVYNLSEYDVWVGNVRGNKYGRRHLTLNPDEDKAFWEFTFDEHGYYDYAAIIDYILDQTGQHKVNIIAHSQGNTATFVLCSTRPQYNDKINVILAMGPISYLQNLKGGILPLVALIPPIVEGLTLAGVEEILNVNDTVRRFAQDICTQEINYVLCCGIANSVGGYDPEELEPEFLHTVLGHYLAGSSRQNVNHFLQIVYEKRFARYNYGVIKNLEKYGSVVSPLFDLSKITCPVVLLVGKTDNIATAKDAKLLKESLPNVEYFEMPREEFNHIDFVWAKHMSNYLFPYIRQMLNKYSP